MGGGLLLSHGGWTGVKAWRAKRTYQRGDERILAKGDFVAKVLAGAQEELERKYRLTSSGYDLGHLIERVAQLLGISSDEVVAARKARHRVQERSLLYYRPTTDLGMSLTQLTERLPVNQPAISQAVKGAARLAREREFSLGPKIIERRTSTIPPAR